MVREILSFACFIIAFAARGDIHFYLKKNTSSVSLFFQLLLNPRCEGRQVRGPRGPMSRSVPVKV